MTFDIINKGLELMKYLIKISIFYIINKAHDCLHMIIGHIYFDYKYIR